MSTQLAITKKLLDEAKHPQTIVGLEAVKTKWVQNYKAVSGREDGELKYEAEKNAFLRAIEGNSKLQTADPFSIYCAWVDLAASESTLREGHSYIVPFEKSVKRGNSWEKVTQVVLILGWKDRLEKISNNPRVLHVQEPQVVYDCDEFEYEKGEDVKIHKHVPKERNDSSKITHVYLVVKMKHGKETYIMDRVDVLAIRDKYSASYKYYASMDKKKQEEMRDKPMWVTDEAQAFKKTIVKRVYNLIPKTIKQITIDEHIVAKVANMGGEHIDEPTIKVDYGVDVEEVEQTEEENGPY